MGCKVSKSLPEPCASKILGCNKLSRSYSSPIRLADVQNSLQNPKCETFHVVSLTSSTYGSLPLASTPLLEEEQSRAALGVLEDGSFERIKNDSGLHDVTVPYSWAHETDPGMVEPSHNAKLEDVKPQNVSNCKQEQCANMWELMESLEDKKAALQMLQSLMEKSRDRKSSSRMSTTIHTVEELDNILDVRRSFPTDRRFQRRLSMEPVIPVRDSREVELDSKILRETPFSMELYQLSLAMQKNQEPNDFNPVRGKGIYRSQELYPTGRSEPFHEQDLDFVRSNLTRSLEYDSLRRSILSRNQGIGFTRTNSLSQSQEFVRPPLAKPKEVVARRQSHSGVPTAECIGDYERKVATSRPDPVLRSPMMMGLSGSERSRVRVGHHSPISRLASPKLSGLERTSFFLDEAPVLGSQIPISSRRSSAVAVTPATSQRGAEFSSLRNRNSKDTSAHLATQPAMSKYLNVSKPIDDSPGINIKAKFSVSKVPPPHSFAATSNDKANVIVPEDGRSLSTVKQSGWTSSSSKISTSSTTSSSTGWSSSASKIATPSTTSSSTATSSTTQKTLSEGVRESEMDDSVSSGHSLGSNTELLDQEDRRSTGSLPPKQPSQTALVLPNGNSSGQNTIWSLDLNRPNTSPLDPELLASFEEALELFCADDWNTVRLGESDAAVPSGSISELDNSPWQCETMDPRSNLTGESKLNRNEVLDDQVEKPLSQPGVLKNVASSKTVPLEIQEQKSADPLENFEKKCPPGGEERCVLYTTSLRGIRKTFDACSHIRAIVQSSDVLIDERDIAMHAEFRQEMTSLAGKSASVPRLFIKGRHIGDEEEVSQLHEKGLLSMLLEGLPRQVSRTVCDGCGGVRFIPCSACSGSCKVITQGGVTRCKVCNENGLSRCPVCL